MCDHRGGNARRSYARDGGTHEDNGGEIFTSPHERGKRTLSHLPNLQLK